MIVSIDICSSRNTRGKLAVEIRVPKMKSAKLIWKEVLNRPHINNFMSKVASIVVTMSDLQEI